MSHNHNNNNPARSDNLQPQQGALPPQSASAQASPRQQRADARQQRSLQNEVNRLSTLLTALQGRMNTAEQSIQSNQDVVDGLGVNGIRTVSMKQEATLVNTAINTNIYRDNLQSVTLPVRAILDNWETEWNTNVPNWKQKQIEEMLTRRDKLSENTHIARWYKDFEFFVRQYSIPLLVIERYLITKIMDENLRAKYLLKKEVRNLNGYENIKKWVYNPPKGKMQILVQEKKIFNWSYKNNTNIVEALEHYDLVIREYLWEIKFATKYGVPEWEIQKPNETALVNHFLKCLSTTIQQDVFRTMKQLHSRLNMALLRIACEKVHKMRAGHLGLELKDNHKEITNLVMEKVANTVQVCAMRAFRKQQGTSNWGRNQNKNGSYNNQESYNNKSNNKYNGRNNNNGRFSNNGKNNYNNRTRNRIRRMKMANQRCFGCNRKGHLKKQCWKLYPHLKKSYFERQKQRKQLFCIGQIQLSSTEQEAIIQKLSKNKKIKKVKKS